MLAIRTIAIMAALTIAASAAADEVDVHLSLVDEATIDSSRILLGDVARLSTADPALSARLEAVPIGRVARIDRVRRLEASPWRGLLRLPAVLLHHDESRGRRDP